jgi:MFS family permease
MTEPPGVAFAARPPAGAVQRRDRPCAPRLRQAGRVRNLRDIARVLRHRDYRFLWLSQTTSSIGDAIVFVALALFVIDRTGSATDLGLVLAAGVVPLLVFLLVGGVWADRLPRHAVVIVTDLARFALHALLAVLIFTGEVTIWQLVVIEALFGAAEAFFRPADIRARAADRARARHPAGERPDGDVAQRGHADGSRARDGAGADRRRRLGVRGRLRDLPRQRGVSHPGATAPPRARRLARPGRPRMARRRASGAEMREGYREVRSRAWIWATLLAFSVINLTGLAPLFVLGPIVARERYGHTAVYGVVVAILGVGTIAGSLAGVNWRPRHPMRMATLAIMLWPPSIVLFGAGVTLWLVLPAVALAGLGVALFDVWWLTALAERVPPDKLSRVTSYDWVVSLGLLPLGLILAGPLASALGAVAVLIAGSTLAGLAIALALLSRETWTLERLPRSSDQPGLP